MPTPTKLMVRVKTFAKGPGITGGDDSIDKDPLMFVEKETGEGNPWDEAHQAVNDNPEYSFAEPDLDSSEDF